MTQKCKKYVAEDALFEFDYIEYQRNFLDIAVEHRELEL